MSEGMPNAVLESLAHGRAVVASAVGGVPEILEHGGGVLVPPGDPEALADAMRALLADPAMAARLGAEGRAASERPVRDRTNGARSCATGFIRALLSGAIGHRDSSVTADRPRVRPVNTIETTAFPASRRADVHDRHLTRRNEGQQMTDSQLEISSGTRFAFGANWNSSLSGHRREAN